MLRSDFLGRARGGPRVLREMDNRINLNWYLGQPWYRRGLSASGQARVVGLAPDRRQNFIYVNQAFECVRALAGVMFYQPKIEAAPRSIDPEDIARAHAAADLGESLIESTQLSAAYYQILLSCHINGHGWLKCTWDYEAGQRQPEVKTVACPTCARPPGLGPGSGAIFDAQRNVTVPCPTCNTQGVVNMPNGLSPAWPGNVKKYVGLKANGDVRVQFVHPDDVYTDPDANSLDESEELVHLLRMAPEQAWRTYGKQLGLPMKVFMEAPHMHDNVTYNTNLAANLMRPTSQKYIAMSEYYKKPDDKHPEGIMGIFLGDKEIWSGPLPYMHDSQAFPFFSFPMYQVYGLPYPMATLDMVLPIILAYNEHLSALHARARLSAKLRLMIPDGSMAELNDQTGHLTYKDRQGRAKPEAMQLAPFPSDATAIRDILGQWVNTISGATDIVRGQAADTDSAKALSFLEERAMGPLKPVIAAHAGILDRVIKYIIDLARLFYDDGRTLRRLGAEGMVEAREFRVENVGESSDVKIRTVRDVGRSRASMMGELNEAAQNSMITAEEYRELAEFGDMGKLYEKRKVHSDLATYENQQLEQFNTIPNPLKYQNHDIHVDIHNRKMNELVMRSPGDPKIAVLMAHMDGHEQLKAQEAVSQQMLQQQASAAFGMANAAAPENQSPAAQEQVAAAGPVQDGSSGVIPTAAEPIAEAGPAGTSANYQQAVATAGAIQPEVTNG